MNSGFLRQQSLNSQDSVIRAKIADLHCRSSFMTASISAVKVAQSRTQRVPVLNEKNIDLLLFVYFCHCVIFVVIIAAA